jgi:hypothetical protein
MVRGETSRPAPVTPALRRLVNSPGAPQVQAPRASGDVDV